MYFFTWCRYFLKHDFFVWGGRGSRKPYVILMGGDAKCLLLMTRGEGGGSKIPKTCLRNIWMFPNPFLRFFPAFLKFNHANQNSKEEGVNQVPQKWTSFKVIFICLQSGLPIDLMNTPMSRVSCLNVVNSENKADQLWVSLPKIQIYYITLQIFPP